MNTLSPRFWLGALLSLATLARAQTTQLTVDATHAVRTVDERVFGLNAVMWDPDVSTPDTLALLQAADVRTIRVPGGSLSDEYHWSVNKSLDNTWTWATGFDGFSKLITGLNSQAFVTVNYGSGTAEEAAAWVAYANAPASLQGTSDDVTIGSDAKSKDWQTAGYWSALRAAAPLGTDDGSNFLRMSRSDPLGLKYWEIGNECYGSWETDQHALKWDPVTYATAARDYIAKMKAVDPTIKIGVVVQTGEDNLDAKSPVHEVTNPRTGASHHGWTPVVLATLKTLGVTPDFLIYHRYEQAPGAESDAGLLQAAKTWTKDAADLRQMADDYLGADVAAGIELCVTENNSVYSNTGKQTTSLVNGLYYADSIGHLLQTEFNALLWWDLRNGQDQANNNSSSLYGWRPYGDYGILSSPSTFGSTTAYDPYPTYYVMKLVARFARGGDTVIKAASDSDLLTIFAAHRADGSLGLLVINKQPTTTSKATVTLDGFDPGAKATVYSYGIPQDDAAKKGSGSTDLAKKSMTITGAVFTASFAPYSVTLITIPSGAPAAASVVIQPVARTTEAGQSVTFSLVPGGSPAPTYQWQRAAAGGDNWLDLKEGGSYRGVTTAELTVSGTTAAMSGDRFRCVVTNVSGSATSDAVTLTVSGSDLLQYPVAIARGADGVLYVADSSANVIRKITTAGAVSTLAGTAGTSGSADGAGAAARFNQPGGLAVDGDGVVYVADTGNATIRKITSAGAVTTFAGSPAKRGGVDGTGAAATFNGPSGLALDGDGNLYVADTMNSTIRRISTGGVVTTVAGSTGKSGSADGNGSAARFNHPLGVAADGNGVVYVADTGNHLVRKLAGTGEVTTLAGLGGVSGSDDGEGLHALFNQPAGVTVTDSGDLLVADTGNSTIRRVSTTGSVTTFAGVPGVAGADNGKGTAALFNQPHDLVLDGTGGVYVADTGNAAIRKVTSAAVVSTFALTAAPADGGSGGGDTGGGGSSGGGTDGGGNSGGGSSGGGSSGGGGGGGGAPSYPFIAILAGLGWRRWRRSLAQEAARRRK